MRTRMEELRSLLSPPTGTSERPSRVGTRSSIVFYVNSKRELIKYVKFIQIDLQILTGVPQERRARLKPVLRGGPVGLPVSPPSDGATTPTLNKGDQHENDSEAIARNIAALKARARGGKGKKGGKGVKGAAVSASGSESDLTTSGRKKAPIKAQRKWVDSAPTEDDYANLDYSAEAPPAVDGEAPVSDALLASLVDESSRGTRGKDGLYEVKDWEFLNKSGTGESEDDDDIISRTLNAAPQGSLNGTPAAGKGYFGGLLSRLTGGKVLTKEDLTPILNGMKDHLMKKNVAREIAEKVCESVGAGLEGKKVGGFKSMYCLLRGGVGPCPDPNLQPSSQKYAMPCQTLLPGSSRQRRRPMSFSPSELSSPALLQMRAKSVLPTL